MYVVYTTALYSHIGAPVQYCWGGSGARDRKIGLILSPVPRTPTPTNDMHMERGRGGPGARCDSFVLAVACTAVYGSRLKLTIYRPFTSNYYWLKLYWLMIIMLAHNYNHDSKPDALL